MLVSNSLHAIVTEIKIAAFIAAESISNYLLDLAPITDKDVAITRNMFQHIFDLISHY
jgi:hypothetical protein